MRITNTSGKRIGYICFDLSDDEVSPTIILRILPADGFVLRASPADDDDVLIQARETGSGDPWTDIEDTPIDLSSYLADAPVNFDLRAVAGSPLVDIRRLALYVSVTSSGPAQWAA